MNQSTQTCLDDGRSSVHFEKATRQPELANHSSGNVTLAIAKQIIRDMERDLAELRDRSASARIYRQLREVSRFLLPTESRRYRLFRKLKDCWGKLHAGDAAKPHELNRNAASSFSYFDLAKTVNCEDSRALSLMVLSAVHRSGSTLMQRLCNARKKTLLWGEHGCVLTNFTKMYAHTDLFAISQGDSRRGYFESGEDPNQWIACMTPEPEFAQTAIVNSARTLLNTLYCQRRDTHDVIGFKEVRYSRFEIELLRRCYPEANLILLVRDPYKTWNSTPRNWYSSLDEWTAIWSQNASDYLKIASTHARCHLIRYEDVLKRNPKTLERFFDVSKITSDQFESVMAHKIGSKHFGVEDEERDFILQRCREPMEAFGYA